MRMRVYAILEPSEGRRILFSIFSQRARKRIKEVFGWVKTVSGGWKLRYCVADRNRYWMEMTTASYNLVRLAKLTA